MALPELIANSPVPGAGAALTTLASAVLSTSATSITVAGAAPAALQGPGQFRITVDSEIMLVTGGAATTTWTVVRGADNSTPATHPISTSVFHYITAGALDAAYARVGTDAKVAGPGGTPLATSVAEASRFKGAFGGLPVVATHNHHTGPYGVVATTTANARIEHVLCADVVEVRFVYVNWSGGDTPGVNPLTIGAGFEFPLGTIGPVTFGGKATPVLDIDGIIVSDPIAVDGAKGASIFSRTWVSCATSWPEIRLAIPGGNERGENGAGLANKSLSGTIGNQTYPVPAYCPSAVIGVTRSGTTRVWVAGVGDSIINSFADFDEKGFFARALEPAQIPFLLVSLGGERAQNYAVLNTSRRRRQISSGATYVYDEYGVNDVFGGRTVAQLQADKLAIWTFYANRGSKVFTQTLTPRATSTDVFATLGNQTIDGGTTNRNTFNAWIRDGSPIDATTKAAVATGTNTNVLRAGAVGHPLAADATNAPSGYVEIADIVESARDSGKWKVTGVSGTGDITIGSSNVLNATGAWAVGHVITGVGIPSVAKVGSVVGSTLGLVDPDNQALNATATTVGLPISASFTQDGSHPAPIMDATIAAAFPTGIFA